MLTGTDLRAIAIGRIEAAVNRPALAGRIREHIHRLGPRYEPEAFAPVVHEAFQAAPERRPSLRLRVPQAGKKPDDFYRHVVDVYTWLAGPGGSTRPAVEIANENGVPPTTVHRWIKEARARGLLVRGERTAFLRVGPAEEAAARELHVPAALVALGMQRLGIAHSATDATLPPDVIDRLRHVVGSGGEEHPV
jgi:hypothetical protein